MIYDFVSFYQAKESSKILGTSSLQTVKSRRQESGWGCLLWPGLCPPTFAGGKVRSVVSLLSFCINSLLLHIHFMRPLFSVLMWGGKANAKIKPTFIMQSIKDDCDPRGKAPLSFGRLLKHHTCITPWANFPSLLLMVSILKSWPDWCPNTKELLSQPPLPRFSDHTLWCMLPF